MKVVSNIACSLTLIFNKRKAFSLKLFSILWFDVYSSHHTKLSSPCYFCDTFAAEHIICLRHQVKSAAEVGCLFEPLTAHAPAAILLITLNAQHLHLSWTQAVYPRLVKFNTQGN